MLERADEQSSLADFRLKDQRVSLDLLEVVIVPGQQDGVDFVEVLHVRDDWAGEVEVLKFDVEVDHVMVGQRVVRDVRATAQEPVLAKRRTAPLAVGYQQDR